MGLAIYKFKHLLTTFDNNPLIGLYRIWGQFPWGGGQCPFNIAMLGLYLALKTRRRTHIFYASSGLFFARFFANSLRLDSAKNLSKKLRHICRKWEPAPSVFSSEI